MRGTSLWRVRQALLLPFVLFFYFKISLSRLSWAHWWVRFFLCLVWLWLQLWFIVFITQCVRYCKIIYHSTANTSLFSLRKAQSCSHSIAIQCVMWQINYMSLDRFISDSFHVIIPWFLFPPLFFKHCRVSSGKGSWVELWDRMQTMIIRGSDGGCWGPPEKDDLTCGSRDGREEAGAD